mgnify:CR=1 FL=1|tara:strand:+ start:1067 stop:1738 length:672 start_codon:yes stop_codon:yes gene_type:complete
MKNSETSYIDHGDWAEGISKMTGETIYVTKPGYYFTLLYDVTKPQGKEFSGLKLVSDVDLTTGQLDDGYLKHFNAFIGPALPELAIWKFKSAMDSLIATYRETFDQWSTSKSEEAYINLEESHERLNDIFQGLVSLKLQRFPCDRNIGEKVRSYYESSDKKKIFLNLMITSSVLDSELKNLAIEETFTNNVMFHPGDIYDYFLKYRDFLAVSHSILPLVEELA